MVTEDYQRGVYVRVTGGISTAPPPSWLAFSRIIVVPGRASLNPVPAVVKGNITPFFHLL